MSSAKNNGCYGYMAGIFTAVMLQPLDNIKMALILPPSNLSLTNNFAKNAYLVSKFIYVTQGWKAFYKGLVSNVWKTGISSSVFFYSLRSLEGLMQNFSNAQKIDDSNMKIKFVSSSLARVASALVSNPLGVLEARYEIAGKEKWEGSVMKNLMRVYQVEGMQGFFKGGLASCQKEGLFAGMYYTLYEQGKRQGIPSLVSGVCAGLFSTLVTHPFQIVRTNIQVELNFSGSDKHGGGNQSIGRQLLKLQKQGQLLKGVAPRLVKKPLSNTLAFLLFEYLEKWNPVGPGAPVARSH